MIKLFLYIGTHKTGTTSLQAFLVDNKKNLRAKGIHVFTEKYKKYGEIGNCLGFAHAILRPSLMTAARMTGDMTRRKGLTRYLHRRRIRHEFAQLPDGSSAIISAEALCCARTDEEKRLLNNIFAGLDVTIIPILCVRNEAEWRRSWNAELRTWADRMIFDFGEGIDDIRKDWYFNIDDIITFWEGVGTIAKIDYGTAVTEHGSVLPALLGAAGISEVGNTDRYFLRKS